MGNENDTMAKCALVGNQSPSYTYNFDSSDCQCYDDNDNVIQYSTNGYQTECICKMPKINGSPEDDIHRCRKVSRN